MREGPTKTRIQTHLVHLAALAPTGLQHGQKYHVSFVVGQEKHFLGVVVRGKSFLSMRVYPLGQLAKANGLELCWVR